MGLFSNSKAIKKGKKQIRIKFVKLWAIEIGELGGEGGDITTCTRYRP